MKIIALYLPQYHQVPENDEWWGEGFTEWNNVKNAKPLFDGHEQPKVPLDHNYYDLSDVNVMRWQTRLAETYGIYGFCFYHYWFSGKMLLEKPVENYLHDAECNLPFCICWANHHWTNAWVSSNPRVLMKQEYGDKKEWEEHFNYLLPFFKDKRYIKTNGKPFVFLYIPQSISCLNEMIECWQELAKKNGFEGIEFAGRQSGMAMLDEEGQKHIDYCIEIEPGDSEDLLISPHVLRVKKIWRRAVQYLHTHWGKDIITKRVSGPRKISYDEIWKAILRKKPVSEKSVPGIFVNWDNTPRYKRDGTVYIGVTPQKFKDYLKKQLKRAREVYHKDFLFLFAWNEWSEGGYIEPDEAHGYDFLKAVREALIESGEVLD